MKKLVFYGAVVIAIVLLINVINIMVYDLDRLTEYGYGYLVGKLILFLIAISLAFMTRKHK